MKNSILIFIFALMLASCASTRKIQETTAAVVVESETINEASKTETERLVDTTRTEHGKVVITEIIFDTTPVVSPEEEKPDARASPVPASDKKVDTTPKPTTPTASVDIPGFGQVSGNIKSIRQTVIESDKESKGESKESEKQEETKCNANVSVAEENHNRVEAPAPDPRRWQYIFYIVAVASVVLLYLKRVPILNWIKRILAGLRRIF